MKVVDKCEIMQTRLGVLGTKNQWKERGIYIFVLPGSKRLNALEGSQIAEDSADNSTCWFNVTSKQCHCHK